MRKATQRLGEMTAGERCLGLAYALLGAMGGILTVATISRLTDGSAELSGWYELWAGISGGIGTSFALYLAGDLIGHAGWSGHRRAIYGGIWVTIVAALICGSLALPILGTMFAPLALLALLASKPSLVLLLAAGLAAVHILVGVWRRERDSIFLYQQFDADNAQARR